MITSALISQCRREFGDVPKSVRVERAGNGTINLFNVGKFPVVESSYTVYLGTSAKVEGTAPGQYQYNLDNGDLQMNTTPTNGQIVKSQHKYANWNDKMWLEAINAGVQDLNGRGFFRQVVRFPMYFSANVRSFSAISATVDVYEALFKPSSGSVSKLPFNWSYQQDANKMVFGNYPTVKLSGVVSYLRNMQTYGTTSATLDVKDDWLELVKKFAGSQYFTYMAGKIATRGNATIEEGHFSFTNARTQARDLRDWYNEQALRKKPTRPAKEIQWMQDTGGIA